MVIVIGGNGYWSTGNKITVLQSEPSCAEFSLAKSKEGILINTDIFDDSWNPAGHITDNVFTVIRGDNSYSERRGDLSTLAVYDGAGTERLYVRYLNPSAIKIRGIFSCPPDKRVTITDDTIVGGRIHIHMHNSCTGIGNAIWRFSN
jgi:hypothetical protein